MNIFDTHCDTPFEMFRKGLGLDNDKTAVSLGKASKYTKKLFVTAFWSDKSKNGEDCFSEFLESSEYFDSCVQREKDRAMICRNAADITECAHLCKFGAIKAVEGAKLLCGDISRLDVLYRHGIRLLLPLWGGTDIIGGAWDTDSGLTDFGKSLVRRCRHLGIVVDTSHMSKKSYWDTAKAAEGAVIASHSNFSDICPHKRNLDSEQTDYIIKCNGLIGLNLCSHHISEKYSKRAVRDEDDFLSDALRHIYYCLERGGEKNVCLGCDWDGTNLPPQIPDVSYAVKLYEGLVSDGISESLADDIFFNNAYNFFVNNI